MNFTQIQEKKNVFMNAIATIQFKPVTIESVDEIKRFLSMSRSRTCDYTVAGILMWAEYFHYEYAVVNDTLFIKGVAENDLGAMAFSAPIGEVDLMEAINMIVDYCRENNMPVMFSAVPEDRLADFYSLGACEIEELVDWADYLYKADDLATLQGNKYGKKRNHVNKFAAEHPGYEFCELSRGNIKEVRKFYKGLHLEHDDKDVTAEIERRQVFNVLDNYDHLPFEGAVLCTPECGIVAFAIGEVIGDTLYVHIEKMLHDVNGAGETINKLFAAAMRDKYGITYVNREEDVGDEGLRKAKMSYHPVALLKKYNLTVEK